MPTVPPPCCTPSRASTWAGTCSRSALSCGWPACAVGAVFEASRLYRECRLATPAADAYPSFATILAVALTAYTVAVSLWLLATT